MVAQPEKTAPYGFAASFERAVATLACFRPKFYGKIGHAIEKDAMPTEPARLAVQAAHAINHDLGHGPDSLTLVLQRLRRWQEEGKVTYDQTLAVSDMFDAAEDEGLPSEESVLLELAPLLKRRIQHKAIQLAMSEYANRSDLMQAAELITRAARLGANDTSLGVRMGGDSFSVIEALKHVERLPTGIAELDMELGGGMPRSQLGMFVGGPGGGKSMALSHLAAFNVMCGLSVGYATLELPDAVILARLKSAITGIPIDAILDDSREAKEALAARPIGPCIVKSFTPQATTVEEIKAWVNECEDAEGRRMDVLVVDYADKLTAPSSKGSKDKGSYQVMQEVYEGLRLLIVERGVWGWTASQSTGRKDATKAKKLDLEHVSDSIHKARVVDLAVTLNLDGEEMLFYVAKNRTGRSRQSVGPLPVDFSCGLVSPIVRPEGAMGVHLLSSEVERGLSPSDEVPF